MSNGFDDFLALSDVVYIKYEKMLIYSRTWTHIHIQYNGDKHKFGLQVLLIDRVFPMSCDETLCYYIYSVL
jgi:hypothetical protein